MIRKQTIIPAAILLFLICLLCGYTGCRNGYPSAMIQEEDRPIRFLDIKLVHNPGHEENAGADDEEASVQAEEDPEVVELFAHASGFYESGDFEKALNSWGEIIEKQPGSTYWGKAVYNSGVTLRRQEKYVEAISMHEKLLQSKVNDREPGEDIMEAYRNYRHKACLRIASCYESLKEYDSALKYANLAKTKYPYQTWCGTCAGGAEHKLEEYIVRLKNLRNSDK
ncbi:MAG: tetratricopeptide repeat protein [Planctomycetota bacterium]|jgi:tetratricopeptide (TPR) repeat protein